MKTTKLTSLLKLQFNLHKSRTDGLVALIFGIIQMWTINLALVASTFRSKHESADKRLQRFIRDITFAEGPLAYLILKIVELDKQARWRLVLDRTNWKFGKKHINILYLAVCCERLSVPIFFTFLRGKKSGNSNQEDRIVLMEKFTKIFGKKRIEVILGDREFIGCMSFFGQLLSAGCWVISVLWSFGRWYWEVCLGGMVLLLDVKEVYVVF